MKIVVNQTYREGEKKAFIDEKLYTGNDINEAFKNKINVENIGESYTIMVVVYNGKQVVISKGNRRWINSDKEDMIGGLNEIAEKKIFVLKDGRIVEEKNKCV